MRSSQNLNRKPERTGIALIVSGPSGAGKSSVYQGLKGVMPDLHFSVSCTTRPPRGGETDGIDYHFISESDFRNKIAEGAFLEYAEVHGHLYGTLKSEITDKVAEGTDVLLDIDVQGAIQIQKYAAEDKILSKALETVFIGPPSFEELERRLRLRGTESEESLQIRLRNARKEMEMWNQYGYLIINKELDKAVEDLKIFIDVMHKSTRRLKNSGFFI
jgi:guanylate kinase